MKFSDWINEIETKCDFILLNNNAKHLLSVLEQLGFSFGSKKAKYYEYGQSIHFG